MNSVVAPTVLLTDTTRWASAARLAIGLSGVGVRVSAVCPQGHPVLKTRVIQHIFPYSGLRPLPALRTAIEVSNPQIIIPCDDRSVQHLHELHAQAQRLGTSGDEVASLIERSLGPPESYPIVSARYKLLNTARDEGFCVPATALINTLDDLDSWLTHQPFPWVLKGDGTSGGRGVKIARTRDEAEQFFRQIKTLFRATRAVKRLITNRDSFWLQPWWRRTRPAVIAQSYVHGRPANCAVVCSDGKVLAGIGVEVISSEGPTGPATVVRVVDNPEMMRCAERIACKLRLSGFFGLDFMIEEGTGATYLIEMNPRCTGLCHLQLGRGRDMIEALRAQLSGQPHRENSPVTQNDLIILPTT